MKKIAELLKEIKDEKLESEATRELIKKFTPKINKSCSRIPVDFKEDVKQDIIIDIIKAAKRFEFYETPDFWSFNHHQLNTFLDEYKKECEKEY